MMPSFAQYLSLLAAQDSHRVWGRFDHQRPGFGTDHLLTILAAIALVVAGAIVWYRSSRRPPIHFSCDSSARLFRELCRAHGLSSASRRLLKRLAAARNIATPALLFVDPQHFDAKTLPTAIRASETELGRLHDRLFGAADKLSGTLAIRS